MGLAVPIIKVREGKKKVIKKGEKMLKEKVENETRKGKSQFIQKIIEQVERKNISKHDDDDDK